MKRRAIGLFASLILLVPLGIGHVAQAHSKKWKTALTANSPFPNEVFGEVGSSKAPCKKGRKVRLIHNDGVTGNRTPAGRTKTLRKGTYSIVPQVESVPGDTWTVKVLKKVLRRNASHKHICLARKTMVAAADVTTISSSDGSATLEIPKGAVDESMLDQITVETIADPSTVPIRYRGTVEDFGDEPDPDVNEPPLAAWDLQPGGLQFTEPAHLSVTVDGSISNMSSHLLSGEGVELVEIVPGAVVGSPPDGGPMTVTLAIRHFSNLSLLPRHGGFEAEMLAPGENEEFLSGETVPTRLRFTLRANIVDVLDVEPFSSTSMPFRVYTRPDLSDGWTLRAVTWPWTWIGSVSGTMPMAERTRVFRETFTIDGEGLCGDAGPGYTSLGWIGSAEFQEESQNFDVDGNPLGEPRPVSRVFGGGPNSFDFELNRQVECVAIGSPPQGGPLKATLFPPDTLYEVEFTDPDGDTLTYDWSFTTIHCGTFTPGTESEDMPDNNAIWSHPNGTEEGQCPHDQGTSHPGTIVLHVSDGNGNLVRCGYSGSETGEGPPCG